MTAQLNMRPGFVLFLSLLAAIGGQVVFPVGARGEIGSRKVAPAHRSPGEPCRRER